MALLHVFTDGEKEFYVQDCIIWPDTIHNHTSYYIKKSVFSSKVVLICSEHQYKMELLNSMVPMVI
jgi:hypothetical protein